MVAPAERSAEVPSGSARYPAAAERLIGVVRALSQAREIDTIMSITRDAARQLTGADGATFILREGDECYYAHENAVSPLWKGQSFPMSACLSGWVMANAQSVMIPDIDADDRIPYSSYRPTFAKSVAMVPIRRDSPIGAIGIYWGSHHLPTDEDVAILEALADTTSVAIENVQLYHGLQAKVQEVLKVNRNLVQANEELERFTYICSHDLHEPVRMVNTYSALLQELHAGQLDEKSTKYLGFLKENAQQLQGMIEQIISFSRVGRETITFEDVDCTGLAREVIEEFKSAIQASKAHIALDALPVVHTNPTLMRMLFRNLIGNALKFQKRGTAPEILVEAVEAVTDENRWWQFCVHDNGIGIAPEFRGHVFSIFQRIHRREDYPGTAIGLSICKKFIELRGGSIDFESAPDKGTTFRFTLPQHPQRSQ